MIDREILKKALKKLIVVECDKDIAPETIADDAVIGAEKIRGAGLGGGGKRCCESKNQVEYEVLLHRGRLPCHGCRVTYKCHHTEP